MTQTHNEEPDIDFEESIPSDGRDVVGEKMIEDLGRDKPAEPIEKDGAAPDAEPMPDQFPAS